MTIDIAAALTKLANAIFAGDMYKQSYILDPYIIGTGADFPTNTAQPITATIGAGTKIKMFYVGIEVRSMGTATYVALGKLNAVQSRLVNKNAYQEFEAPKGAYIVMNDIYIVSDTADPVVEVTGVMIPQQED
jgi:hypothetical protein